MKSACHPLSWFTERIGKKIKRPPDNRRARGAQPNRKNNDLITVINKTHAQYLFELQEEQGYRYLDLSPVKQNTIL